MNLVVADEFRDGNVPAQQQPLAVARRAFQALPPNMTEDYFRGDSACHEAELIGWLRDENRTEGPQGRIGFRGERAHVSLTEKAHSATSGIGVEAVSGGFGSG
jgi:hypothetical protein